MAGLNRFLSTRLIIVLALVSMLLLSFMSFWRINRLNQLSALVNHANLIKLNLLETYSDLSDADSELSKHILTSEVSYREAMMEFQKKIYHSIGKLKELTANTPYQSRQASILDSLIQVRFELMKIELHAASRDYKKITSDITDCNRKIISIINILKENENRKLAEVESSLVKYKSMTPVTLLVFEIIAIAFLIFAYFRADKELTIRRSLQKELENQVQFIQAILDNSVDLILVLDVESNLVMANRRATDLLGIEHAMIGKNIWALFPTSQDSKSRDAITQALDGKHIHISKHEFLSIDRTLESFFIPLYQKENVTAVLIIHHDISALIRTSEELEVKNEQLRKNNQALEQFAYIASHDLQEPLRKIRTYSDFAWQSKNDAASLSNYLTKISASAEKMSNLIKDVLHYSRASNPAAEIESVDLNIVYSQAIFDLELFIHERGAIISSAILPIVQGHKQQLSQVFFNLLHNAIKFCDSTPVITIECRAENGFYYITIRDNGIGFDQQYKDQIFEMFRRIPNSQNQSGSGIGLAVCRKIIDNHGGSITVRSELGKGTIFEIRLPIPKPEVKLDILS